MSGDSEKGEPFGTGGDRSPSSGAGASATSDVDRKYPPPPASPSASQIAGGATAADPVSSSGGGGGGDSALNTDSNPSAASSAPALSAALLTATTASDAVHASYELHAPASATITPAITDDSQPQSKRSRRRRSPSEDDETSPYIDDGMGTYRGRSSKSKYQSSCGAKMDRRLPYFFGKPMLWAFSKNFWAGFSVSLINVPMSIALAIASSCPPVFGVVTAFWAGLLGSIFGMRYAICDRPAFAL